MLHTFFCFFCWHWTRKCSMEYPLSFCLHPESNPAAPKGYLFSHIWLGCHCYYPPIWWEHLQVLCDVVEEIRGNHPVNPLSTNPTKCPNTLKQFVSKLLTNCWSIFGHLVLLALKGLSHLKWETKHLCKSKGFSFMSEQVSCFYFLEAKFTNVL